jgi:aminocarboxymuconate-semialdehyde decarboxylase
MPIDVHAHALSERFLHDLQNTPVAGLSSIYDGRGGYSLRTAAGQIHSLDPHLHNLERRLTSLKSRGVTCQLFGPNPALLSTQTSAASVELVRAIHKQAIEIQAESGGLMEALGVIALGEPSVAVQELECAIDNYGFRGVMLPTSAGTLPLDHEVFADLFTFLERKKLFVFLHPTSGFQNDRFGINGMNVLLGWPSETTLAVTRLIFSGTLDRHPTLKMVLAHGGGNLVFLRGRLNAAYEATGWEAHPYYRSNIAKRPTDYLDLLFYDTCVLSTESLDMLVRVMGAERVLFGSDYPFDVGDAEGRVATSAISCFAPDLQSKILTQNAKTLLS